MPEQARGCPKVRVDCSIGMRAWATQHLSTAAKRPWGSGISWLRNPIHVYSPTPALRSSSRAHSASRALLLAAVSRRAPEAGQGASAPRRCVHVGLSVSCILDLCTFSELHADAPGRSFLPLLHASYSGLEIAAEKKMTTPTSRAV